MVVQLEMVELVDLLGLLEIFRVVLARLLGPEVSVVSEELHMLVGLLLIILE